MRWSCLMVTILIASFVHTSTHAATIPDANLAAVVREALDLKSD